MDAFGTGCPQRLRTARPGEYVRYRRDDCPRPRIEAAGVLDRAAGNGGFQRGTSALNNSRSWAGELPAAQHELASMAIRQQSDAWFAKFTCLLALYHSRSMRCVTAWLVCMCAPLCAQTTDIKVDQVGYLTDAPKLAMVVAAAAPAQTFIVHRGGDNATLFRGALGAPVDDPDSGDRVQIADFSKLTAPGVYFLEVPGVGQSWNFTISPHAYARAFYLAMRSYYGQRCGTVVDLGAEFAGYRHDACHLKGAYHESSGKSGPHPSA